MLWLTIRRSTASWPFSLISASSRKPEITRSRASGSTTSSTPGVANSATASIKLILLVNGMVWSVRVGMAWHSPQRPVLKFGFLSDRLDAKKMSIPSSGSGSPGCAIAAGHDARAAGAALTRGGLEGRDARVPLEVADGGEAVVRIRARLPAVEQVRHQPRLARLAQGRERAGLASRS